MSKCKLCLGTVQFGLDYGVNNPNGKPPKTEVFKMLDKALSNGITCFDTAGAYGTAEALLGEYGIKKHNVKVISKLKPNLIPEDCTNPEAIVEEQVRYSLATIGVEYLDGYLLHTPENFYNKGIMRGLQHCREKGLIKNLGVSIYEVQHALDVVSSEVVDYIQVPYSVFDQRVANSNFFEIARKNNITVFARSAFLQGLILMEQEKVPAHLDMAKEYLTKFDDIIKKYGYSRAQAAFLFTYTHPDVDYIVFGVDNIKQLEEDLELPKYAEGFANCRAELSDSFQNVSKSIIFPSLWARKK